MLSRIEAHRRLSFIRKAIKKVVKREYGRPLIYNGGAVSREEPRVDAEQLEMVMVPRRYYAMGYGFEVRGERFCEQIRTFRIERGIPESSDSIDIRLYDESLCRCYIPRREEMGVALFLSRARPGLQKKFNKELDERGLRVSGFRIVGEYENFSFPDQPELYRWAGFDLHRELVKINKRRKQYGKERRRAQRKA